MKIKTDHKCKPFVYRYDVPAKVLADQFSHLDKEEIDHFFKYKGHWYHLSDFMRYSNPEWDGASGDSYFSGTLIKLSKDNERYLVASYFS